MEVTEEQLAKMIQSSIDKAIADKHPGTVPAELTEFKNGITEFAKQITEETPVRYDSMSQAINSIIRTELRLKRINDLPLSQLDQAEKVFDGVKRLFA